MTSAIAYGRPRRQPSAGRLGALAGVTPIAMLLAWNAISGWSGTTSAFALATAEIAFGAIVAGWIVGGRIGRSIPARLLGLAVYGFIGYLVLLPLNVVGSIWEEVQSGRVSDPIGFVVAVVGFLLYGALTGIYLLAYLLPFGAGWIVTFLVLRRAFER